MKNLFENVTPLSCVYCWCLSSI